MQIVKLTQSLKPEKKKNVYERMLNLGEKLDLMKIV
jgi:hypothetical protein